MSSEQPNQNAETASLNQTTARVAWATAAFAFSVGMTRWLSPGGETADAVLGLVVAGGAAYLAVALQQVPQAVEGAMRISFASGVANGLMLPLAIATALSGSSVTNLSEALSGGSDWALAAMIALAMVVCAVTIPWTFYWTLRLRRVRHWFDSGMDQARSGGAGLWVGET